MIMTRKKMLKADLAATKVVIAVPSARQFMGLDLQADWIKYLDVKPQTQRNYLKGMKKFAAFCKQRAITRPTESDIIEFKQEMTASLSASSAQLYLCAVKLFFRFLAKRGLYDNVADHIKGVRISTEHKRDALTESQCRAVVANIDTTTVLGLRNRAILALMIGCGLRSVEVIRADVADVELWQGEYFLRVQGKGRDDKAERVKLPAIILHWINEYLSVRGDREGALFKSTAMRNKGERLQTQTISRTAKAAFRAVGIDSPRLTCHSCRHSFATTALKNGVDIAAVAMVLRHRSINTTQIYRHDIDRLNNRAETTVAQSIFGGLE